MNGVINLSILDGWWDEGYDGENGWAIKPASPAARPAPARPRGGAHALRAPAGPASFRSTTSAREGGYSAEWIRIAKRSMASLLPRYDASRMLGEYVSKYYLPAVAPGPPLLAATATRRRRPSPRGRRACAPRGPASRCAASTRRSAASSSARRCRSRSRCKLNGLAPADVCVELLLARGAARGAAGPAQPRAHRRRDTPKAASSATASTSSPGSPAGSTTASASSRGTSSSPIRFELGLACLALTSSASAARLRADRGWRPSACARRQACRCRSRVRAPALRRRQRERRPLSSPALRSSSRSSSSTGVPRSSRSARPRPRSSMPSARVDGASQSASRHLRAVAG